MSDNNNKLFINYHGLRAPPLLIIIIEGLSLLQDIPPAQQTKTQTQMSGGRGTRKLLRS